MDACLPTNNANLQIDHTLITHEAGIYGERTRVEKTVFGTS